MQLQYYVYKYNNNNGMTLHCLPSPVSPGFRGFSPTSPSNTRQVAIFKIRGQLVIVMGFRKGEGILNLIVPQGWHPWLNSWYRLSVIDINQ
jgi:hypothetical protein